MSPTAEIVISGKQCKQYRKEIEQHYFPNKIICGSAVESTLPLLKDRNPIDTETNMYLCYDKTCQLPTTDISQLFEQLNHIR